MLVEGRRAAEDNAVMNICWVQDLAEDLPAVAQGPWNISGSVTITGRGHHARFDLRS
jgi:hypothetical protein